MADNTYLEDVSSKHIKFSKVYFLIGIIAGLALAFNAAAVIVVLLGFLLGIAGIWGSSQQEERKFLFRIFAIGLLSRVTVAFLFYFISLARGGDGFLLRDDGIDANLNAWQIASMWRQNFFPSWEAMENFCVSSRLGPYHFWNAFIYYFIGYNPLAMFFINCFIGAICVVLVYKIAKAAFDQDSAVISSWLYAFWPSSFLWSTMNSKEPLTLLFILSAIFAGVKLKERFSFGALFIMLLSIFVLSRIRTVVISILVAATVILSFLFSCRQITRKIILRRVVISAILIFLLSNPWVLKIFTWGGQPFSLSLVSKNIFENINYSHFVQGLGASSAFLPNVDISTPLRTLLYLPLGLLAALFEPFPWRISGLAQLMASAEMLAWYFLLPFILWGGFLSLRYKWFKSSSLLFFIIFYFVTLALLEGNIGTMFRHRIQVVVVCLILASFGLAQIKKRGIQSS